MTSDNSTPTGGGLPAAIERVARRAPDAIAVEDGNVRLTYRELIAAAIAQADRLTAAGVRRGDVVAVRAARTSELAAALLGVLRAGAAYLPIDPGWPSGRVTELLAEAKTAAVLADRDDVAAGPTFVALGGAPLGDGGPRCPVPLTGDDLAAVLFTSGSTGRPKVVGLTHGGLLARFVRQPYLDLRPADRTGQLGNVGFDILGFELWGTLLAGATVVGLDQPDRLSGVELASELARRQVSVVHLTSAWFATVGVDVATRSGPALRTMLFGGESIGRDSVQRVAELAQLRLVHLYGPTEITSFATADVLSGAAGVAGPLTIGRPLPGTDVFVVDEAGALAPIGVAGEVLVGGAGVARGYLGQSGVTAERFVPHPYPLQPGERAYRTGDLARWRADGRLEFLGRRDGQVKLRGHRIEPEEVAGHLRSDPRVRDAAVVLRDEGVDARLVGYVVPADRAGDTDRASLPGSLLDGLRDVLPDYLAPSAVVVLDRLPLTPRGKLDRAALPAPQRADGGLRAAVVAPRTPVERQLVDLFREVLDTDEISVEDSFFDLGGHSVLAMQLAVRISDHFDLDVPMRTLFDLPTIAQLAAEIDAVDENLREPVGAGAD